MDVSLDEHSVLLLAHNHFHCLLALSFSNEKRKKNKHAHLIDFGRFIYVSCSLMSHVSCSPTSQWLKKRTMMMMRMTKMTRMKMMLKVS